MALLDRGRINSSALLADALGGTTSRSWSWRSTGGAACLHCIMLLTIVVMDTLHVVAKVPSAWKAVAWKRTLTALVGASKWLGSMSVHTVCLALVAKKTGSRRETGVLARNNLATVRLQVRVDEFAGEQLV